MKLHKLQLTDFRGFHSLEVSFEPDVTVLVGVNGAGKSTVLDAMSGLLTQLPERIRGEERESHLTRSDIRASCAAAVIALTATVLPETRVSWSVSLKKGFPDASSLAVSELAAPVDLLRKQLIDGEARLPLAVHLATNRSALDIPERIRTAHDFDPMSAYDKALDTGTSDFRGFFEWFRDEEDLYNERKARSEPLFDASGGSGKRAPALDIVRRGIEGVFPRATDLRIERKPQRMTLLLDGVRLDVAQLSDGEKCLLAMTGDIARRMVLADQISDKPLEQEAVVLIDEIELHLHPALQRTILPRLRGVFPNTQFIVSTHSPQVLASVRAKNVRVLENFALRPLERETWRRDTNQILEGVFGDPGRPHEVALKLNDLRAAVDDDRVDDARRLIDDLRKMLEGDDDPDVRFFEQLLPPRVDGAAE